MTENAKIHELFKCIQHSQLQDTVKALKVKFDLEGLTYTQTANHLAAAVSELPEHQMACNMVAATMKRKARATAYICQTAQYSFGILP